MSMGCLVIDINCIPYVSKSGKMYHFSLVTNNFAAAVDYRDMMSPWLGQ
jgi:hypothetical protein